MPFFFFHFISSWFYCIGAMESGLQWESGTLTWFNAQCLGAPLQLFRDGGVWVSGGPLPWEGWHHEQAETSQPECALNCSYCGHLPVTHTENKCTYLERRGGSFYGHMFTCGLWHAHHIHVLSAHHCPSPRESLGPLKGGFTTSFYK